MAAPRPLPPPPDEHIAVEVRKKSKRNTERKKANVAATSTSVSPDGLLPVQQVTMLLHFHTVYNYIKTYISEYTLLPRHSFVLLN